MTHNQPYTPPAYGEKLFNCPHCGAYAQQHWTKICSELALSPGYVIVSPVPIRLSWCNYCDQSCLWLDKKLAIPDNHGMPPPNSDLPDDVKELYNEAASIVLKSPRAATALLRVALEKLLDKQGYKERMLSDKIGKFIHKEKPPQAIVKTMKAIRDTGNKAAHAADIDFNENPRIAKSLFYLINYIAKKILTDERETREQIEEINSVLSANKEPTE